MRPLFASRLRQMFHPSKGKTPLWRICGGAWWIVELWGGVQNRRFFNDLEKCGALWRFIRGLLYIYNFFAAISAKKNSHTYMRTRKLHIHRTN